MVQFDVAHRDEGVCDDRHSSIVARAPSTHNLQVRTAPPPPASYVSSLHFFHEHTFCAMTAELSASPQSHPASTTELHGAPAADLTIITESYRCQYPSKRCTNERSIKRDGDLHKLCEWHRSKANRNQRKLEQKKKIEARSNRSISGRSPRVRSRRQRTSSTNSTASTSVNEDDDEFADERATWEFLEELDDQDLLALGCLVDASSISL